MNRSAKQSGQLAVDPSSEIHGTLEAMDGEAAGE
jgi:hypothetical protein